MDRRDFLRSTTAAMAMGGLTAVDVRAETGVQTPVGTAREAEGRDKWIGAAARALESSLVRQRRDFHIHPELTWKEARTAQVVAERLREIGLTDIKPDVAKYGVTATLRGGQPGVVVGVRADMDALPITELLDVPYKSKNAGVKHACGHDVHTTIGLGVAEVLHRMRDRIPGSVRFYFQPAEEGGRGAQAMVDAGALANPTPRALFALHVSPNHEVGQFGYASGIAMAAADRTVMTVKGRMSHGAQPENSIDSILVASQCISALQAIRSRRISTNTPLVVSFGSIHGGNMFNVIPAEVVLEGTIRTLNDDVREEVRRMMRQTIEGVAQSFGATAGIEFHEIATVTYNEPKLVDESLPTLTRLHGADNVMSQQAVMGAEDFSYMQKVVPGFYFNLGVRNKAKGIGHYPVHTPEFDVDEACLPVGVTAMASMVWDYLERHAGEA